MKTQLQILTEDINRLLKRTRKTILRFKIMNNIRNNDEFDYKNQIYLNILEKLKIILENIKKDKTNLLLIVSSVRFIFETLIHTELIKKEPEHVYRLIYSIYKHQTAKIDLVKQSLNSDLITLKKLIKIETEFEKYLTSNHSKKEINDFKKQSTKEFWDILLSKTHPFLAHVNEYDLKEIRKTLTKVFVPKYDQLIIDIEKEKKVYAKKILSKKFITDLFDFRNQTSKVFTVFDDSRTWETKAKIVGLGDDYHFIYSYTSLIIHSTSYSLITTPNIDNEEISYNLIFIRQHLFKILNNIDEYLLAYNSRYTIITSPQFRRKLNQI